MPNHDEERAHLNEIASQLIAGSRRRPTVADLQRAAGVERWILTHRHTDIKKAFQESVSRKWGTDDPEVASATRAMHDLKKKYENARARNAELEELVLTYAAVIEELRVENRHLVRKLAEKRRRSVSPIR